VNNFGAFFQLANKRSPTQITTWLAARRIAMVSAACFWSFH